MKSSCFKIVLKVRKAIAGILEEMGWQVGFADQCGNWLEEVSLAMIMTWWPTPWTAAWLILRPISRLTPWLIKDPMTEPWVSEWRNPLMTPWLTPRLIPWSTPRLTDIVMFLCRRAILCNGPGAKRHKFQHPEGSSLREPWNYCFWKVEKQQFTAISPFGEEVLKHRGHFRSHNTYLCLFQIHCTMWSFLVYWSHLSKPCFRWQCQTWWHFSLRQSQDSLPLPATSCFLFSIIVNHHGHDHKLIIKIETYDNKIRSGFPPPWLQEGSGWISRSYRLRKKTNDWSLAIYFIMMTTMMILKIMMKILWHRQSHVPLWLILLPLLANSQGIFLKFSSFALSFFTIAPRACNACFSKYHPLYQIHNHCQAKWGAWPFTLIFGR